QRRHRDGRLGRPAARAAVCDPHHAALASGPGVLAPQDLQRRSGCDRVNPGGPTMQRLPDRRQFVQMGLMGVAGLVASHPATEGELLYNGIRLPTPFPPQIKDVPRDPVTPAYLTSPPAVIPIDVGRQLLVDDFLIERTTLTRSHHRPAY